MVRVLHVITTLDLAGAELLLHRLLTQLPERGCQGEVVCLAARGEVADLIEAAGWPVRSLGMRPGRVRASDVASLRKAITAAEPEVVHTWMYHADLLGGLVGRTVTKTPVVWSLHQSALPHGDIPAATRAIARINAALSWVLPSRIVATSESARRFHSSMGYRRSRMVLLPSAFVKPTPGPEGAVNLRRMLGVEADTLIVGRVGRLHAQKDFPTLLTALAMVLQDMPSAHAVLIGRGVDPGWTLSLPTGAGIRQRVHLLGVREDAPILAAQFDVAVSSSAFGESTPLVIGEAMASGVPVVTTDVGDSATLVGGSGFVVPPGDPEQLAAAITQVLRLSDEERKHLGRLAEERIAQSFSLPVMADRYAALYRELSVGPSRPGR